MRNHFASACIGFGGPRRPQIPVFSPPLYPGNAPRREVYRWCTQQQGCVHTITLLPHSYALWGLVNKEEGSRCPSPQIALQLQPRDLRDRQRAHNKLQRPERYLLAKISTLTRVVYCMVVVKFVRHGRGGRTGATMPSASTDKLSTTSFNIKINQSKKLGANVLCMCFGGATVCTADCRALDWHYI